MNKNRLIKEVRYKGISTIDVGAISIMFISMGFVTIKGLLEILEKNQSELFAFAIMCVGFAFIWLKFRMIIGWWN